MKKEELIKLYEFDFVKKFDEEELEILLDLPNEIVKLMLENEKCAKFIFELIKNELDLEHINIALKYANMIENNNLLSTFVDIVIDEDLIKSEYYEYVLSQCYNISDKNVLESFGQIAWNQDLLDSKYYKQILELAKTINDYKLLDKFGLIVSNCDLLSSKHYKSIVEIVSKVTDAELLEKYNDIICAGYFVKLNNFDQVMNNICKITDKEVLKVFLGLSLDLLDDEQVILLASTIQEPNILECFEQLALSKHFKQTSVYMKTLEKISKCTDPVFAKVYVDILCNNNIYENNVFDFVYNIVESVNSPSKLNNIHAIVNCNNLLKSQHFTSIVRNTIKYDSLNLSPVIGLLNHCCSYENSVIIIEQINKILSINNENVIMDLLNELKVKLVSKVTATPKNPFSDIEIDIEKNKLINILMKTKGENIEHLLEEVSIDEEIDSNTYVKIKH